MITPKSSKHQGFNCKVFDFTTNSRLTNVKLDLGHTCKAHAKQLLKVRTIYVFLAKLYPKQLSPEKSDKSALSRKFSQTLEKWFALRVYFIRSKF